MTERLSINTLNPNSPQCVSESLEDRPDAPAPPTSQAASGLCQSDFLRTCPDCPVTAEEMWKTRLGTLHTTTIVIPLVKRAFCAESPCGRSGVLGAGLRAF